MYIIYNIYVYNICYIHICMYMYYFILFFSYLSDPKGSSHSSLPTKIWYYFPLVVEAGRKTTYLKKPLMSNSISLWALRYFSLAIRV